MDRPIFNCYMKSENFKKYYWYKSELQDICKKYDLPSYGTKYELTSYIVSFLDGKPSKEIKPVRIKRRKSKSLNHITLSTPILDSGFSLNSDARKFFCKFYGVKKFSFTKAMGIKMREIERSNDKKAVVKDLLAVYENKDIINLDVNNEEKTYQWNTFVKNFRQDCQSTKFNSTMKVASILWKHVKNSDKEKIYAKDLINRYYDEIKGYLKN
ncbi:SAP domain-containing protein [Fructilactobacillus carniphilus]|uniref:SAP domain-containing protein n=1 Tax=Fructilactobacillus carniphilus TaxID=2940297 RepID=A0ABY5BX87_9LACO|nr:SAP domain-containing protein [Fructilactobacillus carniphilus]USS90692.1 SAP domain-containing protein [Fructilactobacillus carniphilus]